MNVLDKVRRDPWLPARVVGAYLAFWALVVLPGVFVAPRVAEAGRQSRAFVLRVLEELGITSGGSYTAPTLATVLASGADGNGVAQTNLGSLVLATDTRLSRSGASALLLDNGAGGSASLTAKGSITAESVVTGLQVHIGSSGYFFAPDNGELRLGNGPDLTAVHNGADTLLTNATGNLTVTVSDGASALNLSASNIAASSSGVAVVGSVVATGFALDKRSWAQIRHEESSGTEGGTFTLGDWRTRTLNTLVDPESIVTSLTSNQFTLAAGTYEIHAVVQANKVNGNQLRVYDTTNTTTLVLGLTCYAYTLDGPVPTLLQGRFTLSGSAAIELQHYGAATRATDGFGVANSFGVNEVYADVIIYRIN